MSTALSLHTNDLQSLNAEVLVLGVFSGEDGPYLASNSLPDDSAQSINKLLESLGATGALDQILRLPGVEGASSDIIALIGLGSDTTIDQERLNALRFAAGSATRQLLGTAHIALDFGITSRDEIEAVAHGAVLGSFSEEGVRSKTADSVRDEAESITIVAKADASEAEPALVRAVILGEATKDARRLVNMPPSHLYPESFANLAAELVKDYSDVSIEVYPYDRLLKEGFGGIAGVGQGSPRKPALAVVKYTPETPSAHVALVGKGITFDTGGNSLKPAASMMTMKCDMAGAASVLHAVLAASELEIPVEPPCAPKTSSLFVTAARLKFSIPMPKVAWSWRMVLPSPPNRTPPSSLILRRSRAQPWQHWDCVQLRLWAMKISVIEYSRRGQNLVRPTGKSRLSPTCVPL